MKDDKFCFDRQNGTHWDKMFNLLFEALMQVDDVVLLELAEHLDLAHRSFLHDLIVVRLLEFLNRN